MVPFRVFWLFAFGIGVSTINLTVDFPAEIRKCAENMLS